MKKMKVLIPTLTSLAMASIPFAISSCSCATQYYTVHFETNGAIVEIDDIRVKSGKTISAPDTPIKLGNTFLGWYVNETCTIPFVFGKDIVYGNMTLYAKWAENGITVDSDQWNTAFDIIGDRTQTQVFSFNGTIKQTTYDNDSSIKQSFVLSDLIFNGAKHWYKAQDTIDGTTTTVDVACEYYEKFFFQGRREITDKQKTVTYKNTDNTDATKLLEFIRSAGNGKFTTYKKQGGTYYYYNLTDPLKIVSSVTFANTAKPVISNLYYYCYDAQTTPSAPVETEFDIEVDYTAQELTFPTNWDKIKYQSHESFGGNMKTQELKLPTSVEGFNISEFLSQTQKQATKIGFYTDKDCTQPYTGFQTGDVIIWVGEPADPDDSLYHTLATSEYASGVWTLPQNVVDRIKSTTADRTMISILIKNMPTQSLWVQLEK